MKSIFSYSPIADRGKRTKRRHFPRPLNSLSISLGIFLMKVITSTMAVGTLSGATMSESKCRSYLDAIVDSVAVSFVAKREEIR